MKKIKLLILTLLLFFSTTVKAEVITHERLENRNYGVNKKFKITEKNKGNVLRTPLVDSNLKIYDFSDVLSIEEKEEIYNEIIDFKEKTGIDMIFVLKDLPYNYDSQNEDFAADFYDYNDFGIDTKKYDGILLFRNTYSIDPYYDMYTFGEAQLYFNQKKYDDILDSIYNDFHSGNYVDGFKTFKEKCLKYYNLGKTNRYYIDDNGFMKKKYRFPLVLGIILSSISTLVTTLILIFKNKMVKKEEKASEYLNKESIVFKLREDKFSNSVVTSYKVSSSSSGGGSGSSGGGHSSGGGRHG